MGEVRSKEKSERSCEAWGQGRRGKNLEASTLAAKSFDFPRRFGSGETISVRGEGGCVGGVRTACSNWSPSIRCIRLSVASSAAFSTVATRPSARQPLRQIASCSVSFVNIGSEIQLSTARDIERVRASRPGRLRTIRCRRTVLPWARASPRRRGPPRCSRRKCPCRPVSLPFR